MQNGAVEYLVYLHAQRYSGKGLIYHTAQINKLGNWLSVWPYVRRYRVFRNR